jgi:hypothetical protein
MDRLALRSDPLCTTRLSGELMQRFRRAFLCKSIAAYSQYGVTGADALIVG